MTLFVCRTNNTVQEDESFIDLTHFLSLIPFLLPSTSPNAKVDPLLKNCIFEAFKQIIECNRQMVMILSENLNQIPSNHRVFV